MRDIIKEKRKKIVFLKTKEFQFAQEVHTKFSGWLVVLCYGILTLFGSFNTELNFQQSTLV